MTKTNCLTYKCIFILMNGFIRMKKKVLIGIPVRLQKVGEPGQ